MLEINHDNRAIGASRAVSGVGGNPWQEREPGECGARENGTTFSRIANEKGGNRWPLLTLWLLLALPMSACKRGSDGMGESDPPGTEYRSNFAQLPEGPFRKVVSLTPNLTEMVAVVGAAGALVGRTPFCSYPPEAQSVPVVGGGVEPDVEAILVRAPDLIVAQKGVEGRLPIEALNRAGIQVYITRVETADDVMRTIQELGRLTGHPEAGAAEAQKIADGLAKARGVGDASRSSAIRVLMLHGHRPLVAAGPGSWGDELIRLAGYRNALGEGMQTYPTLDAEWVVQLHPDVIVDTSFAEDEGKPEDFWRFLAGQGSDGPKLVFWTEEEVLRPGPRLVRAVELLRQRVGNDSKVGP